jgi:sugar lactone lactonase YvrE
MAGLNMKSVHLSVWIRLALLMSSACATPAAPVASPTATLPPTPVQTSTIMATSIPGTPSPPPTSTLSPIITDPQIIILADHLTDPDDLLLAPDGSIFLSDVGDGTIKRYTDANGLQLVLSGLVEPEGMVLLPDGSLVIAEQGRNRLVRYDLNKQTLAPFLDLTNKTGQAGVDGLAWDASSQTIILPDSPNGTILRVSPDGRTVTQIASGFARPTGAWVEPDGGILVVDENGNSLISVHPDGRIEKLDTLSIPDDVIEDGSGNILVVTLGDNAIHLILRGTGQDKTLSTPLIGPQGIIFAADGNLIVTDPGNHRLLKLVIHSPG